MRTRSALPNSRAQRLVTCGRGPACHIAPHKVSRGPRSTRTHTSRAPGWSVERRARSTTRARGEGQSAGATSACSRQRDRAPRLPPSEWALRRGCRWGGAKTPSARLGHERTQKGASSRCLSASAIITPPLCGNVCSNTAGRCHAGRVTGATGLSRGVRSTACAKARQRRPWCSQRLLQKGALAICPATAFTGHVCTYARAGGGTPVCRSHAHPAPFTAAPTCTARAPPLHAALTATRARCDLAGPSPSPRRRNRPSWGARPPVPPRTLRMRAGGRACGREGRHHCRLFRSADDQMERWDAASAHKADMQQHAGVSL